MTFQAYQVTKNQSTPAAMRFFMERRLGLAGRPRHGVFVPGPVAWCRDAPVQGDAQGTSTIVLSTVGERAWGFVSSWALYRLGLGSVPFVLTPASLPAMAIPGGWLSA
jgi:hypothetical protein